MLKRSLQLLAIALVTLLACGLRIYAAQRLDVDYDEPVYLSAAVSYANYLRAGDFKMLAWNEHTYEHPALYKILYGVALLPQQPLARLPDKDLPRLAPISTAAAGRWNVAERYVSVLWGTLAVLALAVLDPLAGVFLAVDTLSVKYTSEVYLEALPLLASLLSVLAYARWFAEVSRPASSRRSLIWLALSAVLLGMAAAGKYIYAIVSLAMLLHAGEALARKRLSARVIWLIAGWALLCAVMFFVFDPYLWPHPISRLVKSITFHESFQGSRLVQQAHYPFWQPFRWLSAFSSFYDLHPASAFLINIDTLIFVLALIGLPALFQRDRVFFYWLVIGLAFLLIWETKWPQYTLVILAPFSLSSACGAAVLWSGARQFIARIRSVPGEAG